MPEAIMDPEQQIEFDVKAVFPDGEELDFRLMPGLKFITEGIAYEIERDIKMRWGISATEVDLSTPAYPYLMYGPLLEYLAGTKLSSKERIATGLLHSPPAHLLCSHRSVSSRVVNQVRWALHCLRLLSKDFRGLRKLFGALHR
jgi:hypothetical protein